MPTIIAFLLQGLAAIAGSLVLRGLAAAGIGSITYVLGDLSLAWLKSQAVNHIKDLDPQIVAMLSLMKVGEALSIVFSALVVRATLNGLSEGGRISRWVKQ